MASDQTPDALLVKNYVAGDEQSLSTLIHRHQSKIYGFIYSKISDRDITDDIFQDTFIKVISFILFFFYHIGVCENPILYEYQYPVKCEDLSNSGCQNCTKLQFCGWCEFNDKLSGLGKCTEGAI